MMIPKNKKKPTEDSLTASEKSSITRSTGSSRTYSTTAFESDIQSESTTTVNTLSMISTPWSTESWNAGSVDEYESNAEIGSSVFSFFSDETISSGMTYLPKTSTTYGPVSPQLPTSITTLTILNGNSINTPSNSIRPVTVTRQNSKILSDTLSSWTVETYTSSGWVTDIDSKVVKAKYPWSPNTVMSGTDIYPSTLDTLTSRKESRVTMSTTTTFESRKGERGHITPMKFIGLNTRPGEDTYYLLKWAQEVKRSPSIMAAV